MNPPPPPPLMCFPPKSPELAGNSDWLNTDQLLPTNNMFTILDSIHNQPSPPPLLSDQERIYFDQFLDWMGSGTVPSNEIVQVMSSGVPSPNLGLTPNLLPNAPSIKPPYSTCHPFSMKHVSFSNTRLCSNSSPLPDQFQDYSHTNSSFISSTSFHLVNGLNTVPCSLEHTSVVLSMPTTDNHTPYLPIHQSPILSRQCNRHKQSTPLLLPCPTDPQVQPVKTYTAPILKSDSLLSVVKQGLPPQQNNANTAISHLVSSPKQPAFHYQTSDCAFISQPNPPHLFSMTRTGQVGNTPQILNSSSYRPPKPTHVLPYPKEAPNSNTNNQALNRSLPTSFVTPQHDATSSIIYHAPKPVQYQIPISVQLPVPNIHASLSTVPLRKRTDRSSPLPVVVKKRKCSGGNAPKTIKFSIPNTINNNEPVLSPEKKRRIQVREEYMRLVELIPELHSAARALAMSSGGDSSDGVPLNTLSKATILTKSAEYIRLVQRKVAKYQALVQRLETG